MASPEIDFHLTRAEAIVSGNFGTLLSSFLNSPLLTTYVLLGSGVSLCNKQYPLKIVIIMKSGHII